MDAMRSDDRVSTLLVLSGQVTIPPIESYLLHPRTVKLSRIASTLQLNAVNARASSDRKQYDSLLGSVRNQLGQDTSNDISVSYARLSRGILGCFTDRILSQEVLALLVTQCKWPPQTSDAPLRVDDPAVDVAQILVEWATDKSARCMALPPWLAAMLAAKYDAIAAIYVPYLLHSGFLEPGWWPSALLQPMQTTHTHARDVQPFSSTDNAFAHRVAALVGRSERLATTVNRGLAQMDPLVLDKLLP